MNSKTANNCDFHTIAICFKESEISELFACLLENLGFETQVFEHPEEIPAEAKIISEPIFYQHLLKVVPSNRLLVGNHDQLRDLDGVLLSQPLTESKINNAIKALISH